MDSQLTPLVNKLSSAKSLFIAIADQPLLDHAAAALAIGHLARKQGLQVSVLGPSRLEPLPLEGKNIINQNLSGNKFTISWKYQEKNVEEVTTEIQEDRGIFSITIHTTPNSPAIESSQLEFTTSGISADLYLCLGCDGQAFLNNPEIAPQLKTENWFRIVTNEALIANPNATDLRLSSPALCYVIFKLIMALNWPLFPQTATNIIAGLEHRTERYANPDLGTDFFACLMTCLEAGGQRPGSKTQPSSRPVDHTQSKPQTSESAQSKSPSQESRPLVAATPNSSISKPAAHSPSVVQNKISAISSNVTKPQSPKNNLQSLPEWLKPPMPPTSQIRQPVAKNIQR